MQTPIPDKHICTYPQCDCPFLWAGELPVPRTVCPRTRVADNPDPLPGYDDQWEDW